MLYEDAHLSLRQHYYTIRYTSSRTRNFMEEVNPLSEFISLAQRLRAYWWIGVLTLILIIITAFTEGFSVLLVIPMLEGLGQDTETVTEGNRILTFIDGIFDDVPDDQLLQAAAIMFVGLTVIKTSVYMAAITVQGWLQYRLDRELREEVYTQLLSLSYENLNLRRDSDWQMVLNSETGKAAAAVFGIVTIGSSFFTMMVYISALVVVSWQMTLVAAVLLILVFISLTTLVRYADRVGRRQYDYALQVTHGTMETLSAKRIIRIMHQQDYEKSRYFNLLQKLQRGFLILKVTTEASRQILELLVIGLLAAMLAISGIVLNVDQTTLIPIVSTFILILYRMMPHVLSLNAQRTTISANLASVRNVVYLLEEEDLSPMPDGNTEFKALNTAIEFKNVGFRYNKRDAWALRNINLTIGKSQTVALVGSSGAGKSTTVDLLVRLYDPQEGSILVDGVDLRDLRLANWRHNIGVVSQDTFVFNNTIAENIAYGSPDAIQADIEQAAKYANAHDFIQELPEGYKTVVGDRGVLLSGGQRQRIAIARAILRDPSILILDEATSALDTENERLIQAALDHLSQNRTVVVIAHRLSTILNADKIVVMEKGQVVEFGRHDELIAQNGRYATLYHKQFEQPSAYTP